MLCLAFNAGFGLDSQGCLLLLLLFCLLHLLLTAREPWQPQSHISSQSSRIHKAGKAQQDMRRRPQLCDRPGPWQWQPQGLCSSSSSSSPKVPGLSWLCRGSSGPPPTLLCWAALPKGKWAGEGAAHGGSGQATQVPHPCDPSTSNCTQHLQWGQDGQVRVNSSPCS